MKLIKTSLGLPNSCAACGEPVTDPFWFSINEDAAFAGQGVCIKHVDENGNYPSQATVEEPANIPADEPEVTTPEVTTHKGGKVHASKPGK